MPPAARSSSASRSSRSNGSRSAVAWTSTRRPSSVITTLRRRRPSSLPSSRGRGAARRRRRPPRRRPRQPVSAFASPKRSRARLAATYAPQIAAQRVPPSACSTSQSSQTVRSPSASKSTTPRSARPISRWISTVRPPCFPRDASRCDRSPVEAGSSEYSASSTRVPSGTATAERPRRPTRCRAPASSPRPEHRAVRLLEEVGRRDGSELVVAAAVVLLVASSSYGRGLELRDAHAVDGADRQLQEALAERAEHLGVAGGQGTCRRLPGPRSLSNPCARASRRPLSPSRRPRR